MQFNCETIKGCKFSANFDRIRFCIVKITDDKTDPWIIDMK